MKVTHKIENKQGKVKIKSAVNKNKPKKEQVLVVAQEFKYARLLSGNEKKTRDRVLKSLKKWLLNCFEKGYEFKEDDFTRVWKGLFYAVWMSDKPLVQEELCESVAGILEVFPREQLAAALLMVKAGFKVLATEWYGIDQHRIDKFLMLVRRYLRGSLRCVQRCGWELASCQLYSQMLSQPDSIFALKTPHYARNATSMLLHIMDCYLEELSKVSAGSLPPAAVAELLRPIVSLTCAAESPALRTGGRRVLTGLLRQSPRGLEYEDRTRLWKQMGCPEGGPDALVPISDDEEQQDEGDSDHEHDDSARPLDPRAGGADVELRPLAVPARALAAQLRAGRAGAGAGDYRRITVCLERFESLDKGQYPLRVKLPKLPKELPRSQRKKSLKTLAALDNKLKLDADELKLRGLSRKHRKRLLVKSRAGLSIVEDVLKLKKTTANKPESGDWVVETIQTERQETGQDVDTSNKENQNKDKKKKNKKRKNVAPVQNEDSVKKIKLTENTAPELNEKAGKEFSLKDRSVKKSKLTERITSGPNNKAVKKLSIIKKIKENVKTLDKSTINKAQAVQKVLNKNNTKTKDTIDKKIINKTVQKKKKEIEDKKIFNKQKSPDNAIVTKKSKNFQKHLLNRERKESQTDITTQKKVKFVLNKNSMQKPVDYYKSVKSSPSIPFDSKKKPSKTNLKPSSPSPINPFYKKKLKIKH